jgi:hypothetical protein
MYSVVNFTGNGNQGGVPFDRFGFALNYMFTCDSMAEKYLPFETSVPLDYYDCIYTKADNVFIWYGSDGAQYLETINNTFVNN